MTLINKFDFDLIHETSMNETFNEFNSWFIQWNKKARFFDCCNAFIDFIGCDCSL